MSGATNGTSLRRSGRTTSSGLQHLDWYQFEHFASHPSSCPVIFSRPRFSPNGCAMEFVVEKSPIWTCPHVKLGERYRMEEGEIEIDSIEPIGFPNITPQLARASGFLGVIDLLKVAKHGKGENIYLIRFHYIPPK